MRGLIESHNAPDMYKLECSVKANHWFTVVRISMALFPSLGNERAWYLQKLSLHSCLTLHVGKDYICLVNGHSYSA